MQTKNYSFPVFPRYGLMKVRHVEFCIISKGFISIILYNLEAYVFSLRCSFSGFKTSAYQFVLKTYLIFKFFPCFRSAGKCELREMNFFLEQKHNSQGKVFAFLCDLSDSG